MQPDRKTLLLAPILITCMMAFLMSGIMSLIALGLAFGIMAKVRGN